MTYIFSYTRNGAVICRKLMESISPCTGFAKEKYCNSYLLPLESLASDFIQSIFTNKVNLIFIGAAGIAVRKIAPFIRSKETDPAVIVIDEQGKYVIPILSGHIGGANALAVKISEILNAEAVITTATDLQNKFSADIWAVKNGLAIIDISEIKNISSAVLENSPIGLESDFLIENQPPIKIEPGASCGICISLNKYKKPFIHTLLLSPKCIFAGIGCRKNIDFQIVEQLLLETLEKYQISLKAVAAVCSIDLKKNEPALLKLCEKYNLKFVTYTPDELKSVSGIFSASALVESVTGVDNVCERAAVLASNNGALICKKTARLGVTVALSQKEITLRW